MRGGGSQKKLYLVPGAYRRIRTTLFNFLSAPGSWLDRLVRAGNIATHHSHCYLIPVRIDRPGAEIYDPNRGSLWLQSKLVPR